jgi:hypothetical protein
MALCFLSHVIVDSCLLLLFAAMSDQLHPHAIRFYGATPRHDYPSVMLTSIGQEAETTGY